MQPVERIAVAARTGMLDGLDLQGRQRRSLKVLVAGSRSNFISCFREGLAADRGLRPGSGRHGWMAGVLSSG
ncbi:MAG: hypothetical protein PHY05_14230 [Methanothrix sp.]|nr:hypothetical protein [Methanothrix sp.]